MDVSPKALFAKLIVESDTADATLTLTKPIYKAFQAICKRNGLVASRVVDEFMKEVCEKVDEDFRNTVAYGLSPTVRDLVGRLSKLSDGQLASVASNLDGLENKVIDSSPKARNLKQKRD